MVVQCYWVYTNCISKCERRLIKLKLSVHKQDEFDAKEKNLNNPTVALKHFQKQHIIEKFGLTSLIKNKECEMKKNKNPSF